MNILKTLSVGLILILFISCTKKTIEGESHTLVETDEYITFPIDDETYIPTWNGVSHYEDKDGKEYVVFQNREEPEIQFYDIEESKLHKKLKYKVEGANSLVSHLANFYVKNMDEIYLLSKMTRFYRSDKDGNIIQEYDYSKASNGENTVPTVSSMGRIELVDGKFHVVQTLNRIYGKDVLTKSSVGAIIDTVTMQVDMTAFKYPKIIKYEDLGTNAAFGFQYRRIFDGKNFIYTFLYDHALYKVSVDHKNVEKFMPKSKYIDEIEIKQVDMTKAMKRLCEEATYGNIIYDKYRRVYYRFACPETEVKTNESPENLHDLVRCGKPQFSIMILDENFNPIGEKLFPPYSYVSNVCFVNKDGLYISCSHFKREDYSDDVLRFRKIELKEIK